MTSARGMKMQIEIVRDAEKIVGFLELVDIQLGPSRTGLFFFCSGSRRRFLIFYFVHFSCCQRFTKFAAWFASTERSLLFQTT